jgi:hypothetical protein
MTATARKQGDFNSLPEHVKANIRGKTRAKFKRETPDYDQLLAFMLANQSWDICQSFLSALNEWGKLTPKQVECVRGMIKKDAARRAEWAAKRAQEEATLAPVPVTSYGKRIRVTGEVVTVKPNVETQFGLVHKVIVQCEGGYKLYGTLPKPLTLDDVAVGTTISFDARIEPARDSKVFGFFSRPTKAEVSQ